MNSPVSHAASNTMSNKQKQPKARSGAKDQNTANELAALKADLKALRKSKSSAPQAKSGYNNLGKALLDTGSAIGNYFGLGKIFGEGAYKMQNSKWNTGAQVPVMHSDGESVVIRHREYIGDITGTSAFTNLFDLDINPGLSSTFPYLSALASQFQEYRFKGLVFEYKTQSGMLTGSNTALGDVMMVAQYRADAALPTSKLQLLNEMWSQSIRPDQSGFLPIECSPKENSLKIQYIRTGALPASTDQKLYDLANFSLFTTGTPANFLGELWCTYEVELFKPVLSVGESGPYSGNTAHYTGTGQTSGAPFLNSAVSYDDIGMTFTGSSSFNLPCEPGQKFLCTYIAAATTTTNSSLTAISGGTGVVSGSNLAGNGAAAFNYTFVITCTTTIVNPLQSLGGGIMTAAFVNVVNTGSTWTFIVTQIPSVYT